MSRRNLMMVGGSNLVKSIEITSCNGVRKFCFPGSGCIDIPSIIVKQNTPYTVTYKVTPNGALKQLDWKLFLTHGGAFEDSQDITHALDIISDDHNGTAIMQTPYSGLLLLYAFATDGSGVHTSVGWDSEYVD